MRRQWPRTGWYASHVHRYDTFGVAAAAAARTALAEAAGTRASGIGALLPEELLTPVQTSIGTVWLYLPSCWHQYVQGVLTSALYMLLSYINNSNQSIGEICIIFDTASPISPITFMHAAHDVPLVRHAAAAEDGMETGARRCP